MRFEQARWRGPVLEHSTGGMAQIRGLVLHIEEGTERGTESWFNDPAAHASSHFGNPKTGPLDQWVDTNDKAWAQISGNSTWISVEHEGHSGDWLTPSQLENDAQLYAWLHKIYGVPMQLTDDPRRAGIGYHAMGGSAWGGHMDCPGTPIIGQRQQILIRAIEIIGGIPSNPFGGNVVFLYKVVGTGEVWATDLLRRIHIPTQGVLDWYLRNGAKWVAEGNGVVQLDVHNTIAPIATVHTA